jgi:copper chaperone CopZ
VPIAAGLIHMGVSPGAALAFLVAGPATNAATVTTLWRLLGLRVTLIYLATVGSSAVMGGLALDALLPGIGAAPPAAAGHLHDAEAGWPGHGWAVALLAVLLVACASAFGRRRAAGPEASLEPGPTVAGDEEPPRRLVLKIGGMSCSHCAETVRRTLAECAGIRRADVDLATGIAVVYGEGGGPDTGACATAVEQLGCSVEVVEPG